MAARQEELAHTLTVYNDIGKRYEIAYDHIPGQIVALDWLLSHLAPKSSILDIGSGTGHPVATTLSTAGHSVHGIDFSSTMVAAARERAPAARFEEADSRTFTASAEKYDAITAFFSYITGMSLTDIREAFPKIHRWLKPGGLFVWGTVLLGTDAVELRPYNWIGRPVSVTALSREETEKRIREAGFEIIQSETSNFRAGKAAECGLCSPEEVEEEEMLCIYARKLA